MIKHIIMDIGDTIIDNTDFSFKQLFKALYPYFKQTHLSEASFIKRCDEIAHLTFDYRNTIEFSMQNFIMCLAFDLRANLTTDIRDIEMHIAQACSCTKTIEDVELFLNTCLCNGLSISLLSNSAFSKQALLRQMADCIDLSFITSFISSSDVGIRKPHPFIFGLAVKGSGHSIEEILYIGNDYKVDIIGATQVGLKSVWLNHKKQANTLNVPCYSVHNYRELINRLQEIV